MEYETAAKHVPRVRDDRHNLEEWNKRGPLNILCFDQGTLDRQFIDTTAGSPALHTLMTASGLEAPLKVIMHRLR